MTPTRDERIEEIRGRVWYDWLCHARVGPKDKEGQCIRSKGHGLGGLFCKQHAKNNPEITDE